MSNCFSAYFRPVHCDKIRGLPFGKKNECIFYNAFLSIILEKSNIINFYL